MSSKSRPTTIAFFAAMLTTATIASTITGPAATAADRPMPLPGKTSAASTGTTSSTGSGVAVVPAHSPQGVLLSMKTQVAAEKEALSSYRRAAVFLKSADSTFKKARGIELEAIAEKKDVADTLKKAQAELERQTRAAAVSTSAPELLMDSGAVSKNSPLAKAAEQQKKAEQAAIAQQKKSISTMEDRIDSLNAEISSLGKTRKDAAAARAGIATTVGKIHAIYVQRAANSRGMALVMQKNMGYKGTLEKQIPVFEKALDTLPEESRLRLTMQDMKAMTLPTCQKDDPARAAKYKNGRLGKDVLCPVPGYKKHLLRPSAARDFAALSRAFERQFGEKLALTDSYRSLAAQIDVKRRKPRLAAKPGTSNHGLGMAVDLGSGVQKFSSEQHDWMVKNANLFRFYHPDWAQQNGSKPEAWHWEHVQVQTEKEERKSKSSR